MKRILPILLCSAAVLLTGCGKSEQTAATDGKAKTSKGKFSHARDLSDAKWQGEVSDARIFNSIMNGRNEQGNMPPFANKLKEKEIDSLVEFVRRLKG